MATRKSSPLQPPKTTAPASGSSPSVRRRRSLRQLDASAASESPAVDAPSPKPASAAKPTKESSTKSVKPQKPAKGAKAVKEAKAPKLNRKPVRDSFTMPEADFVLIGLLKARALEAQRETKKSELLRAGLHVLASLDTPGLIAALAQLQPVKVGRPKKNH